MKRPPEMNTPKICFHCGKPASMFRYDELIWECHDCIVKGTEQRAEAREADRARKERGF
ncbi:MAG: hypothetical protein KAI66_15705 [Lentisphaeria bacterium]|nr:hypothetical protein [Lentisphaeria bacterium]